MKILHYHRNAESPIHIHAGSYATCFFVPEKNVVLFAEQHGTFGGVSYSINDRKELLAEAKDLLEGKKPKVPGVKFSNLKEFDYDTVKLEELIDGAKLGKELEAKVTVGINALFKEVSEKKDEPAPPIDPKSLDEATQKRLENLVTTYVTNGNFISDFHRQFGHEEEKKKIDTAGVTAQLQDYIKELKSNPAYFGRGMFVHEVVMARKAGVDETVIAELAGIMYRSNQLDHSDKLLAAEILKRPEKEINQIKESRLLEAMAAHWGMEESDYAALIEQRSQGLLPERIKEVAEEAYQTLMNQGNVRYNCENYIHAAFLCKQYGLEEKKFLNIGRELVKIHSDDQIAMNHYEDVGRKIVDLGFPDEIVRPLMVRMFEPTLYYNVLQAKEIQMKYNLTPEEIESSVNEVHSQKISAGSFDKVLELRQHYGHLIKDQNPPTADIQLLDRVMSYETEQPEQLESEFEEDHIIAGDL